MSISFVLALDFGMNISVVLVNNWFFHHEDLWSLTLFQDYQALEWLSGLVKKKSIDQIEASSESLSLLPRICAFLKEISLFVVYSLSSHIAQ